MEWKLFPKEKPAETETYLISIMKDTGHGMYGFRYLALYNADNGTWHKYDAFNGVVGEVITDHITGWLPLPGVLIS
ncbi:hypothetical protein [Dinghuibacter silviterrae]|uniref:DUF551 domain-containing protein n=1 Tax=Dinghuibacter silviterrae TaxID=1539049 RepID=A0A4R8DQQ3_9BACT|nr:hypothetical protein [Dinghuibacter silviterrae]TDX00484.1 hypothetical protein EDB95_1509 [Dinghuibacter silviterrae]